MIIVPTLADPFLSDIGPHTETISQKKAEELFTFFQNHTLFNWRKTHNGCEGRADAICTLLDTWNIPNYKGWVFSGFYLKNHIGQLIQNWNYHVAPVLPVEKDGQVFYYVLDPATADSLQLIEDWAAGITLVPHSYYCIRQSHWYIFPAKNISTSLWHTRNKQNRKWMIQCLAGINGLTKTGRARLIFNKTLLKRVKDRFEKLKKTR